MQDRIARTRRQQTRALDGAGQEPARPQAVVGHVGRGQATNEATTTPSGSPVAANGRNPEFQDLMREFAALAPAATQLYGYRSADMAAVKESVAASRVGALAELSAIVRQWRIDIVAAGLDVAYLPVGEPLVPRGVAERARSMFRMTVMNKTLDENRAPYRADALDWAPELSEWTLRSAAETPTLSLVAASESEKAPKKRKP